MFVVFASGEAFVFESRVSKIDEQADFDPGGVQVVDDLSLMFGGDGFHRFQLDNHVLLHEDVSVKVTHALTPEHDLDRVLGQHRHSFLAQCQEHCLLIDGFKKTRA